MHFYKYIILLSIMILLSAGCGGSHTENFTLYEDAENGLSQEWQRIKGESSPSIINAHNESRYCVNLPVSWYQDEKGNWHNPHEYHLPLDQEHANFLELDVGGSGMEIPHYIIGIAISTRYGSRILLWDSFYTHEGLSAKITKHEDGSATLIFPSPIELVRGFGYESTTQWTHFKVDIAAYLHQFEPDNQVTWIDTFIATGGNLDNIGLSSYR